jgi:hypothetical protein
MLIVRSAWRRVLIAAMVLAGGSARAQTVPPNPTSTNEPRWKEFLYPEDGFAILAPDAPNRHKSAQVSEGTAYVFSLTDHSAALTVANFSNGCSAAFTQYLTSVRTSMKQLKEGTLDASKTGFRPDPSSVKELTVGGYPASEYQQEVLKTGQMDYERWLCVGKRLYILVASWPRGLPRPADVNRMADSFRLLPK